MRYPTLLAALFVASSALMQAQEPPPIRVDVNLIQIDATVTDKQGRRVPDLTAADFEVTLDGKKQQVQSVLWVGRREPGTAAAPGNAAVSVATGGPTRQLTRDQVRRTVAILIDDNSLSFESTHYTREAIRKFIESSIQPGDLVALFRTSSGMSFLQQFTADKAQLLSQIDRIRYGSRSQVDPLAPVQDNPVEAGGDLLADMARAERLRDEINRRENQDMITAGMLGSMRYLVGGLRELPGRKSLILFSESVQLLDLPQTMFNAGMSREDQLRPGALGGARSRTLQALRSLTDLANRNAVSISAIDPRGLQPLTLTVQDSPGDARRAASIAAQRRYEFTASQDGMVVMAQDTGGQFLRNTNDISGALREALDDLEDYYLLGFRPDAAMFEKVKSEEDYRLHRIQIHVKRPGLQVRHRKGFFGVPDDAHPGLNANQPPLIAAMMSPFRASGVPVRITPLFARLAAKPDKKEKNAKQNQQNAGIVRVMVHVDTSKLTFAEQPADAKDSNKAPWKTATVEFGVCLFDEANRIVSQAAKKQEFRLRGAQFEAFRRDGMVEQLVAGVPRAGAYQVRTAIIDTASGGAGSTTQFFRTPDLTKGGLESSDLVVNAEDWEKGISDRGSPALRVFSPGERLKYLMMIYNARVSGKTKMSELETQVAVYRDGKRVLLGPRSPLQVGDDPSDKDVTLSGSVLLGASMPPGTYTLEVTVRDPLAPKKQQYTLRTMDFEVRAPGA